MFLNIITFLVTNYELTKDTLTMKERIKKGLRKKDEMTKVKRGKKIWKPSVSYSQVSPTSLKITDWEERQTGRKGITFKLDLLILINNKFSYVLRLLVRSCCYGCVYLNAPSWQFKLFVYILCNKKFCFVSLFLILSCSILNNHNPDKTFNETWMT